MAPLIILVSVWALAFSGGLAWIAWRLGHSRQIAFVYALQGVTFAMILSSRVMFRDPDLLFWVMAVSVLQVTALALTRPRAAKRSEVGGR